MVCTYEKTNAHVAWGVVETVDRRVVTRHRVSLSVRPVPSPRRVRIDDDDEASGVGRECRARRRQKRVVEDDGTTRN